MNADYIIALRVIDHLPRSLKETRNARRKSLRAVAEECDLSLSTVHQLERGKAVSADTMKKIIQWVDWNQR